MSTRLRLLLTFALTCGLGIGLSSQATIGEFTRLILGGVAGAGTVDIRTGTGSPESVVTGTVGDIFIRTDGGASTTLFVKESGTGNTGWIAYGGSGGAGAAKVQTGTGTPEGAVTGAIGDLFLRTNGIDGTSAYNKISGAGNTGWVPFTTAASVNTFTNKTLNAESAGNDLTIPVKVWVPAAWCQNTTATTFWNLPATDPAVAACLTGTNTNFGTLDYADGANVLSAQWPMVMPDGKVSTIDVDIKWVTSATSGNVVWQVATGCMGNGGSIDNAFNTASTVTDAAAAGATQFNTAIITSLTHTNCNAGGLGMIKVLRDPANGSDTLAATARLLGITLTYRILL